MVETIESTNLPEEMTCTYIAPGAWNRVIYLFSERGPAVTGWEFDTEFRCTGLLRILALLTPGMFQRASRRDMTGFKTFAEVQKTISGKTIEPDCLARLSDERL